MPLAREAWHQQRSRLHCEPAGLGLEEASEADRSFSRGVIVRVEEDQRIPRAIGATDLSRTRESLRSNEFKGLIACEGGVRINYTQVKAILRREGKIFDQIRSS